MVYLLIRLSHTDRIHPRHKRVTDFYFTVVTLHKMLEIRSKMGPTLFLFVLYIIIRVLSLRHFPMLDTRGHHYLNAGTKLYCTVDRMNNECNNNIWLSSGFIFRTHFSIYHHNEVFSKM